MRGSIFGVISFLLSGCAFISETDSDKRQDPDGDGVIWLEDCGEGNSEISKSIWYEDADGDGEGNPESILESCEEPSDPKYVTASGDCQDDGTLDLDGDQILDHSLINPDANEICYDFEDNDCNGLTDEVENNNWDEELFVSLGEGAPKVYYLDKSDWRYNS